MAIIAMANLCGAAVESVLPDVHDGDAAAVVSALTEHPSPTADGSGSPPSHERSSGHAVHVDHCAHAHLLADVDGIHPELSAGPSSVRLSSLVSLHDSVKDAPLSRPPIA